MLVGTFTGGGGLNSVIGRDRDMHPRHPSTGSEIVPLEDLRSRHSGIQGRRRHTTRYVRTLARRRQRAPVRERRRLPRPANFHAQRLREPTLFHRRQRATQRSHSTTNTHLNARTRIHPVRRRRITGPFWSGWNPVRPSPRPNLILRRYKRSLWKGRTRRNWGRSRLN